MAESLGIPAILGSAIDNLNGAIAPPPLQFSATVALALNRMDF